MNLVNKAFLKLVLAPSFLYQKLGVNTRHLQTILEMKLMMDDRKPNTFQQTKKRKEKAVTLATLGTMLMSLLMGCIFLFSFGVGENRVTQLTIFFSFYIFMLSATLISDFTSVLIDVRDNFILLPKPVSDKTVVTARLLHILIHICKLILPMLIPGLIYIGAEQSLYATLVLFFMGLLVTLFCVFLINAVYILILKITTPQRFQSIISSIQIFFAIFLYASYQLIPRMIGKIENIDARMLGNKYIGLAPSYWFANAWQFVYNAGKNVYSLPAALTGLLIPFVSIWIVLKFLAPAFNRKLSMITSSEGGPVAKNLSSKKLIRSGYSLFWSKLITKPGPERMGFLFSWRMSNRSKDFKLKVYPSIGYVLVYVFVLGMNKKGISWESLGDKTGKTILIFIIYSVSLLMLTALGQVSYSEKFKASWIYYITPLSNPGKVLTGSLKSTIVKFYMPAGIVLMIAGIVVIGPQFIPNIILGICNQFLICSVIMYLGYRDLPFSLHQDQKTKSGSFIRGIFMMIVIGVVGFAHYLIYTIPVVVIIFAIMSVIGTWLMLDAINKTGWEVVRRAYED